MIRGNVLLLGGGGFIGRALARRLEAEGVAIRALGRQESGGALEPWLEDCTAVVHLASSTTPGSSARYPARELDNLALTLRLLDALQGRLDIHLVYLSSGGVLYGNPEQLPVKETAPTLPLSYHGAGKLAQEAFVQAFRTQGNAVTVLRPANAYGPGQALKHGFGFVRTTLERARRGEAVELWGDGESVRDFVYVDDVVEAIVRVLSAHKDNSTYNVGSGRGHTLKEVLAIAERVSGRPLKAEYRPSRGMDVRAVVLDNSRIGKTLGWAPQISLEEGIRRTWEWLLRHD